MKIGKRVERDVLGEVEVSKNAYWGIATQRAIEFFRISGKRFPASFIYALAEVKKRLVSAQTRNWETLRRQKAERFLLLPTKYYKASSKNSFRSTCFRVVLEHRST